MKTLGMIGGIAPESTIDYYRQIIAAYRRQRTDGSYPSIVINSIDMTRMLGLIGADRLSEVTDYLLGEVERLASAGADFGLMASNTPHIVFDELRRQSPIPLISIVEAACQAAAALGLRKVSLFGTRFTMQGGFYPDLFAKQGIEVVLPAAEERAYIHDRYVGELVEGIYRTETRDRMLAIVNALGLRENIDGVILGGTDLPMLFRDGPQPAIPLLDTTAIHVEQAVAWLLA